MVSVLTLQCILYEDMIGEKMINITFITRAFSCQGYVKLNLKVKL